MEASGGTDDVSDLDRQMALLEEELSSTAAAAAELPLPDGWAKRASKRRPARHDSAEDFCRLKAPRCTAMDWIFIPAFCFAVP